jgi:dTDP-glucose 4,6-dehydratase
VPVHTRRVPPAGLEHEQSVRRPTRDIHRVVTGGAGFLGSHLCTRLVAEGVEVVCLDNLLTGSAGNVGHLQGADGFRFLRCDVTDFVHVPGPVDAVLHFAPPPRRSTTCSCPSRR